MALSLENKVEYLWKKLMYGVSNTATTDKDAVNETIFSPVTVSSASIWLEGDQITYVPPTHDTSVVECRVGSTRVRLVNDPTVTEFKTWLAKDEEGRLLGDWIPPTYGPDYMYDIRLWGLPGYPNGLRLNPLKKNIEWVFDPASGVLSFPTCPLPNVDTASFMTIDGYRYIGKKGFNTLTEDARPQEYEIAGSIFGRYRADETVMRFVVATRLKFIDNIPASQARCRVTATDRVEFSLIKNGGYFGRIIFDPGAQFGVYECAATYFFPKDELLVVSPSNVDATLEDVEWTMVVKAV